MVNHSNNAGPLMKHKPKIAILMATWNGSSWVAEQLNSILASTGVDVRVFINDDCSNDKTLSVIKNVTDPRIERISIIKCGGAAQNFFYLLKSVNFANFEYVALSDQDDVWHREKLVRSISQLADCFDAYSSNVTAFWSNGARQLLKKSQPQKKYDYLFESGGPGCTFVFTRETAVFIQDWLISKGAAELKKISMHDWLIYALLRNSKKRWIVDDYSSLDYRQHASNAMGASRGLKQKIERLKLIRSNWYGEQVELVARIIGNSDRPVQFVKMKSAADYLYCLKNTFELRRKKTEALVLLAVLTFMFVFKNWGKKH